MNAARIVASIVTALVWLGLALQLAILAKLLGGGPAIWRFVGFFTILSNIGVGLIATAIALGGKTGLAGARARLIGLTAILTVAFVYSLMLRSLWNPQGPQKLADAILHDWTPILFAALWGLMPHGELKWSDFKWALAPPAIYLAYSMARGALEGWYPYHFLDPTKQDPLALAIAILGTLAVFATVAAGAIAIDRRIGQPDEVEPG